MCGICGAVALTGPIAPEVRASVRRMAAALGHRGPDGDGFFADERAALGHRRLAIIDRAGGAQPMSNEDGTCRIVFNGEIYNHRDVRRRLLAHGHRFQTACDTEVIVHAYEQYGPDCVAHLEGMFAFAIYDQRDGSVLLARDRLGKKPLYHAVLNGVLHFASEIKALRASPAWDGTVDLGALETYFALGYQLAPRTIYRHVSQLEPGHWLRAKDGRVQVRRYWDVEQFGHDDRPTPLLLEDLTAELRSAVDARLESEVPLGAFLSGGVDSGLVVSFMAEANTSPVTTCTVGFGAAAHNELHAASLTAARFGTRHEAVTLEPDLDQVLDCIAASFDEPFADASAVPTYYVSQRARQHVTVALSGDGGDETFGGYDFRYVPHGLEAAARHLIPGGQLGTAGEWLGSVWPRHVPRPLRLGTTLQNLSRDPAVSYYMDLCFLKPAAVSRLLGWAPGTPLTDSPALAAVTDAYRRCPASDAVLKAQYADLKIYLPNDVLVKVDRMSMAHSLEVRCPLLDRRVVEAAFRIPTSRKMPRLAPKYLLREIARRRLPRQIAGLRKHGFTAPVAEWLRGRYAARFRDEVLTSRSLVLGLLDLAEVRRLFDEHCRGAADHSYALWAVWMLERWSRLSSATLGAPAASAMAPGLRRAAL
ncbi:MAG: asparagine synthase (glutamine-hydrolyzing) [Acidobacteria bacterium]|nr:asparagine synthase (glutamine-hydrolyzing) [Acidobacteriota bacterium]